MNKTDKVKAVIAEAEKQELYKRGESSNFAVCKEQITDHLHKAVKAAGFEDDEDVDGMDYAEIYDQIAHALIMNHKEYFKSRCYSKKFMEMAGSHANEDLAEWLKQLDG